MSEPSLSCQQPPGDVYRFLWLRTWGAPIAVRIERTADIATLTAVQLDGSGGYHPGQVARNVQRTLTSTEWTAIKQALSAAAFWTMPSRFTEEKHDGARWIVEGRSGARYHLTDRWSPETGAYRELCLLLVRLAGLMPEGDGKRLGVY
jgi:hypothetical protein